MKIMSIAGARPNFMKLAAIARAIDEYNAAKPSTPILHIIVHTGQHYDEKMSQGFFNDLGIPKPDINLEVGSGSHAVQTAEIMKRFEPVLLTEKPDALLVVGDVNSTIACTLVAAKIEYPSGSTRKRPVIVHVEAGLRSFDRDMPEEINRILTDAISDMLFVTEQSGVENLRAEGVANHKVYFVGNVMIDTLHQQLQKARKIDIKSRLGVDDFFGLVTLHRPSNVDRKETLQPLFEALAEIAERIPLVFPMHPRTKNNAGKFGILANIENKQGITITEPLGYLEFLNLTSSASIVITDSGGIQEETTYLGVPCVTLRDNTERPVTVEVGSNYLIGTDCKKILETATSILDGKGKKSKNPPLWDGEAGKRIVNIIAESLVNRE